MQPLLACNLSSLVFFIVLYYLLCLDSGMDAQVAYSFHNLRNEKPYLAQGPIANKVRSLYSIFG